jgi:hypothetical protein
MSDTELRLTYWTDNEWDGELYAEARSGAFSGKSSAWFDKTHIKETFIEAVRVFPITTTIMIEGGYWNSPKGTLKQCHLRILVKPYGLRGALLVQADLATSANKSPDEDLQHSTTIRFLTEYAALDKFTAELEQLLDTSREVATLRGVT